MKRFWSLGSKTAPFSGVDVTRPTVPGHLEVTRAPLISMECRAYQKLFAYIRLFDEEIAGMGFVDELPGNRLHIADVFLVRQSDNTGVHVDISEGVHELRTKWAVENEDDSIARMKFWWHSHVNMTAMWSSTDEGTAHRFGGDYHLSAVGNKRGDLRLRLDVHKPLALTFDDLPLYVAVPGNLSVEEQCRREIGELVAQSPIRRFFSGGASSTQKKLSEDDEWDRLVEAEARKARGYPSFVPSSSEIASASSGRSLAVVVEPISSSSAPPAVEAHPSLPASVAPAAGAPPAPIPGSAVLQIVCDRIRAFPKVETVELTASEIIINTHNLLVSAKYEELWDIGAWNIRIPLVKDDPSFIICQSRRKKVRHGKQSGWIHPHVNSTGTVCLGKDLFTTISFALKDRQYEVVAQLIIAVLDEGRDYDTRNPHDPYSKTLRQIGDQTPRKGDHDSLTSH